MDLLRDMLHTHNYIFLYCLFRGTAHIVPLLTELHYSVSEVENKIVI